VAEVADVLEAEGAFAEVVELVHRLVRRHVEGLEEGADAGWSSTDSAGSVIARRSLRLRRPNNSEMSRLSGATAASSATPRKAPASSAS
jgi:hypothetical protein